MRLPFALRLVWRDWRAGELRLLLWSIVIAVSSVTAVALFVDRLQLALVEQSSTFLAADRILSGSQESVSNVARLAEEFDVEYAETVSFATVLYSGSDRNLLASVKAVSADYPLRGVLRVAAEPFGDDAPIFEVPRAGEVWLDSRLFPALDIALGDQVDVGLASLKVTRVLTREPDRGGSFVDLAPRALMSTADLAATEMLQPGSRVTFKYLLKGEDDTLEALRAALDPADVEHMRWQGVRSASLAIGDSLDRAESFLLLGGLLAVLLAGVAVALAAHRYARRHYDHVAVLKTLGATPRSVLRDYLSVLFVIGGVGALLGLVVGWVLQHVVLLIIGDLIQGELPQPGVRPYTLGLITGFVCLFSFALPPLLALVGISPMRVIRRDIDASAAGALTYVFAAVGVVGLILWYSDSLRLTLYTLGAIGGAVAVFALAAWLVLRGAGALGMQAGSAWRLAMAGIQRRRGASISQMLIFGLAIMLLLILVLVRTSLLSQWRAQLPEDAPNHFVMNVTPAQVGDVERHLDRISPQVGELFPMIRGRVVGVNGLTADDWMAQQDNVWDNDLSNTRNLTYSARFPEQNELVDGEWWPEDTGEHLISLEDEYAAQHGLSVGDVMDIDVAGTRVSGRVTNLRRVDWGSLRPNFFVIFSPPMLADVPTTFMTSFNLGADRKRVLNDFLRSYPTVSVIPMEDIMRQVQEVTRRVTQAIELVLLLVLVSGALVLLASIQSSRDERLAEHGLLRALGGTRSLIAGSLSIEFLTLGALSGLLAIAGAELAVNLLQTEVFALPAQAHPLYWLATPVAGALLVVVVGLLGARSLISSPPMRVLRGIE
ncbi:MAG: FtsX-like permease family protein [Pseudomonadota bacterium]